MMAIFEVSMVAAVSLTAVQLGLARGDPAVADLARGKRDLCGRYRRYSSSPQGKYSGSPLSVEAFNGNTPIKRRPY